jgi:chromate reductase
MPKKIGVIVGSLRKGSFTKSVAEAVSHLFPAGYDASFIEYRHLPLFDQDYELEGTTPESYDDFRRLIGSMDAFVFLTPEYNRSYPGALKNAIDIASRPWGESKWAGKPAAVISVSPGMIGGFGANQHLRQVLAFLNMPLVQQPEAYIGNVEKLLDANGYLTNKETLAYLQTIVDALVKLIKP